MSGYIEQIRRASLAGVLRTTGALVVVAGLCAHLLEEWGAWADLSRLYVLLGVTCMFAVSGFLVSVLFKEQKSARVFVSLGLVAVVASLTTLGGLLEEAVTWQAWRAAPVWLINSAAWQGYTPGQLGVTLSIVLLIIVPVTWIAFRVLARPRARLLSLLFAFSGLLICLPVRESWPLVLTILLSLMVPGYCTFRMFKSHVVFATTEGKFALLSLFFPAIVMLARQFWLYEADVLLSWILLTITFVGIHLLRSQASDRSRLRPVLSLVGVCVFVGITVATLSLLDQLLADELILPLAGLLVGFAIVWAGLTHARVRSGFELLAALSVAFAILLNLLFNDAWLSLSAGVLVGLSVGLFGRSFRNRPVVVVGAGIGFASVAQQVLLLGRFIDFTHWLSLGLVGISLLALAVFVEKRQVRSVPMRATEEFQA